MIRPSNCRKSWLGSNKTAWISVRTGRSHFLLRTLLSGSSSEPAALRRCELIEENHRSSSEGNTPVSKRQAYCRPRLCSALNDFTDFGLCHSSGGKEYCHRHSGRGQ